MLYISPSSKQKVYYNFNNDENELISYVKVNDEILLHSEDDFPSYVYMNKIKIEKWHRYNCLYREHGPSTIITYIDGTKEYIWKNIINDQIEDRYGPSIITIRKDNTIKNMIWMKGETEHRDGSEPSYISYYEDGNIKTTRKKINGMLCSINDEASLIKYKRKDNILYCESYWHFNNKIHRSKYPAVVKYKIVNNVIANKEFEYWYLDSKILSLKF